MVENKKKESKIANWIVILVILALIGKFMGNSEDGKINNDPISGDYYFKNSDFMALIKIKNPKVKEDQSDEYTGDALLLADFRYIGGLKFSASGKFSYKPQEDESLMDGIIRFEKIQEGWDDYDMRPLSSVSKQDNVFMFRKDGDEIIIENLSFDPGSPLNGKRLKLDTNE